MYIVACEDTINIYLSIQGRLEKTIHDQHSLFFRFGPPPGGAAIHGYYSSPPHERLAISVARYPVTSMVYTLNLGNSR